jgi:hypothetical protein
VLIGIGGLALVVAAAAVRWRSSGKWPTRIAYSVMLIGWTLVAQFLLKPLVPAPVVAAILLGGITASILAAALVGSHRTRHHDH